MAQRVLHISVRLSEGGAARVARTIASQVENYGFKSVFAYGYGPHGRKSPDHSMVNSIKLSSKLSAGINLLHHQYRGEESSIASSMAIRRVSLAISNSDIIHLHIPHSYFVNFGDLVHALAKSRKPVMWTLHDQWIMTGRCAQPGECEIWKEQCHHCPNLNAYPPAKLDHAQTQWHEKRMLIKELQISNKLRLVSCASWLAEEIHLAGLEKAHVIHNSLDQDLWNYVNNSTVPALDIKNLFVCFDLRDKAKIDWDVLSAISNIPNQTLTIVGNYNNGRLPNATNLNGIKSRKELANILLSHSRLIFTSKVDYFPLTIMESLAFGLEVLAIDSKAAREFISHPNLKIFASSSDLIQYAEKSILKETLQSDSRKFLNQFSPALVGQKYADLYKEMLGIEE
jgi:putative colanic acid biosynthesis glycosyltransferase